MLISNIGNQHFGNIQKAKELIKASNDHGADLIKSYAITPTFTGHLDKEFYEMCSFCYEEYLELIEYARGIGNDIFFEIFGLSNQSLYYHQAWKAVNEIDLTNKDLFISDIDKENSIVSIGKDIFPPQLLKANVMHSMYSLSDDPEFGRIEVLRKIYNRNIGFMDKTIGIGACIKANDLYNCTIIEKNLTLEKGILFNGKMLDETIYSVLPDTFEKLANTMMDFKEDTVLH